MRKIVFMLLLAGVIFAAGCVSSTQQPVKTQENAVSGSGVKEFSITAKQWEFVPNKIYVMRGDRVRLKIKSIDVTHGFSLASYDVNKVLAPGKEVTVEFTADKPSVFGQFACSVPCGAGHAEMMGQIIMADQTEFEKICRQDGNQWMNMKPMKDGQFVSDVSCSGCMSPDGMNHFCDITDYKNFL